MPMNPRLLRPRASGFDPRSISGLLAWWKFDEEAVNTNVNATDSVGGYTLTAASAPMAATGRTGRARRLRAGTNLYNTPAGIAGFSRATTGSTPLVAQDQSMTFAVWLKPEYAINTGGTSSTPMSLTFRSIGGLDQVRFAGGSVPSYAQQVTARAYYSDGSFASAFCPGVFSTFLPEGVWTHVAVVIDRAGQSLTIYKNGVSAVSSALNAAKVLDGISPGCGVTNFSFPGLVDDAVLYGRALTVSEVGRLAGVPQKPTAVSSLHIEAEVWVGRVIGSGGSVSLATAQAVSDFCTAIDAAGIRDRFYRLNLFCGTADASLIAVRTPLYRGPSLAGTQYGNSLDTNVNFAITDYAETGASGGLTGNGSTRYLQTGIAPSAWMPASGGSHLAVYKCTSTNSGAMLSARFNPADAGLWQNWEFGAGGNGAGGSTGSFGAPGTHNSLLGVTREAGGPSVPVRAFRNDAFSADNTGGNTPAAINVPIAVFCRNAQSTDTNAYTPSLYTNQRLAAYSVGLNLSSGALAAYNTAMQAFQTALGRNV
jgi:hypothetical protein